MIANEIISIDFLLVIKGDPSGFPFAMLPPTPKLRSYQISVQDSQLLCYLRNRTLSHFLNLRSSPELTSFCSYAYALGHLLSPDTVCEWSRLTCLFLYGANISLETIYGVIVQFSSLIFTRLKINAPDLGVLGRITHYHCLKYVTALRLETYGPYCHQFLDAFVLPALTNRSLRNTVADTRAQDRHPLL